MAIVLVETGNVAAFSGTIAEIDFNANVLAGDILMVGVDTNNGAQVSSVRVGANITATISGLTMGVSTVDKGILTVGQSRQRVAAVIDLPIVGHSNFAFWMPD